MLVCVPTGVCADMYAKAMSATQMTAVEHFAAQSRRLPICELGVIGGWAGAELMVRVIVGGGG